MNYIEQRIKQLDEQLNNPECTNPLKVEHKLEAYKEMQQQVKLFAIPVVSESFCTLYNSQKKCGWYNTDKTSCKTCSYRVQIDL